MGDGEGGDKYRRRYGVFVFRRHSWGAQLPSWMAPNRFTRTVVNDGGEDAPMGPRDVRLWRAICIAIVALVVVVAVIVLLV